MTYKPMKCFCCDPVQKYIETIILVALILLSEELSDIDLLQVLFDDFESLLLQKLIIFGG